jgi:hypothetical protein
MGAVNVAEQSQNSFTLYSDRWVESVNARLPNKTMDIFNIKYKWRVI